MQRMLPQARRSACDARRSASGARRAPDYFSLFRLYWLRHAFSPLFSSHTPAMLLPLFTFADMPPLR
jgi:hypothetical protein